MGALNIFFMQKYVCAADLQCNNLYLLFTICRYTFVTHMYKTEKAVCINRKLRPACTFIPANVKCIKQTGIHFALV